MTLKSHKALIESTLAEHGIEIDQHKKTWRDYSMPAHETPRAFACFLIYRDMGASRTLIGVVDYFQKKVDALPPGASSNEKYVPGYSTVKKWCVAFNWYARVQEYDDQVLREKELRKIDRREQMDEEHFELARSQFIRAVGYINELIQNGTFGHTASVAYANLMARLQRLAAGAPTEKTEQTTHIDGEAELKHSTMINPRDFTDDELEQLRDLALALKQREQLR